MEIKARLHHIDLLECFAIFFVILYHSNNYCHFYSIDISESDSLATYLLYFGRTILSTCVPIFFFVHGYLLFNKEFDLNKHIKKTIRLVMLIVVWSFLLIPIYKYIAGETISFKELILDVLGLKAPYLWFIEALLCIYIFFPPLKALFDSNIKGFVYFIIISAILSFGFVMGNHLLSFTGTIIHHPLGNLEYLLFTYFNPFHVNYGYSFVYFCVGGLMYTFEGKIRVISKQKRNCIAIFSLSISCLFLFLVGVYFTSKGEGKPWDVVWNGYDTVFTFVNVLLIYILSISYSSNNRLIKTISDNTLGIYLLHALFVRSVGPFIIKIPIFCNLLGCVVFAIITLGTTLVVCLLIKRIPLVNKLL